jgi:hypothetical protein
VAERATAAARAVAAGDGPLPALGDFVNAPTRELARRLSGTVEVLLLWHPEIDGVELSVRDRRTGAGFHLEVAPDGALDAFHHPYAYATRPENSGRVVRAASMSVDE